MCGSKRYLRQSLIRPEKLFYPASHPIDNNGYGTFIFFLTFPWSNWEMIGLIHSITGRAILRRGGERGILVAIGLYLYAFRCFFMGKVFVKNQFLPVGPTTWLSFGRSPSSFTMEYNNANTTIFSFHVNARTSNPSHSIPLHF